MIMNTEFTDTELAEIWCRLNTYDWPEEYLGAAPEAFTNGLGKPWESEEGEALGTLLSQYMTPIYSKLGQRAVLYHWNVVYRSNGYGMTPEQFDKWWNERDVALSSIG